MTLSKSTRDGLFTITIESGEMDEAADIPIESIEALIYELEVLRAQLVGFLIEAGRGTPNAN